MVVKTFRTDPESEAALAYLTDEGVGTTFSEIVRTSLLETARAHRQAALRAEAEALAADPAERAAAKALAEEMSDLSAW